MTDAANAARAIDALRRGWPVCIGGAVTVLAIETADDASLSSFDPDGRADILISAGRAFTLKLANQIEAAVPDAPVLVARRSWLGLSEATALADPALDLATPIEILDGLCASHACRRCKRCTDAQCRDFHGA